MGTANHGGGRKTQNLTPVAAREPLNYEQTLLHPDTRSSQGIAAARKLCRPDDQDAQRSHSPPWPGGTQHSPGQPPSFPTERRGCDVFLMIRRHKTTIFTDAKESSTVFELKRIVEGILKRPPDEQRLYKDDQLLDDGKTLGECGFTSQTARPQAPATVGLAFRADEAFEALRIEPFSSPPELPDVMKPQDSGSSANEQAVQ
ncbi:unnamed protein product [Nyctereutes procyonoides]|uniref:Elongin-B n=1 Tax=Nyctereutes procyonoides TaxID=34880 RepID=A0A811Z114_NYCPR|nr:unnamed protein product [Nyctereutes procyonoides]